jgi:hypothetical protein
VDRHRLRRDRVDEERRRQLRALDRALERARAVADQRAHGGVERAAHLLVERLLEIAAEARHRPLRKIRVGPARKRRQVEHRREERRAVGDRSAHGTDVVERGRQVQHAVARHRVVAGLESRDAAACRGNADRSGGIRPTAMSTMPAAMAAAEPPLDPPGMCPGATGLCTAPKCGLSLVMP